MHENYRLHGKFGREILERMYFVRVLIENEIDRKEKNLQRYNVIKRRVIII